MTTLAEFVKSMQELLGSEYFIYGSYKTQPNHLPYGNYAEEPRRYIWADNQVYTKIRTYIVRVVTEAKDFALEDDIENIFADFEFVYQKITDLDITAEKVHCVEWEVTWVG
jgi:hypothetical protein